jgi:hypothetical protein
LIVNGRSGSRPSRQSRPAPCSTVFTNRDAGSHAPRRC